MSTKLSVFKVKPAGGPPNPLDHRGGTINQMGGMDENRDPNRLNEHLQVSPWPSSPSLDLKSIHGRSSKYDSSLQVMWDDVIAEPEGIRSINCAWDISYRAFNLTKDIVYKVLTILLGPVLACCMGCQFACLAFQQIWCVSPCLRIWKINCASCRHFIQVCNYAICGPFFETCGSYWSRIKIRYQKLPDMSDSEKDLLNI